MTYLQSIHISQTSCIHISLTGISFNVVVDDLLPAVGEVDVVDALGVVALALLLVPEGRTVVPAVHLVPEPVVRRAATFSRYVLSDKMNCKVGFLNTDSDCVPALLPCDLLYMG